VHQALFAGGRPKQTPSTSVKEAIRKHIRKKHARD
jgi:hypothetical protein